MAHVIKWYFSSLPWIYGLSCPNLLFWCCLKCSEAINVAIHSSTKPGHQMLSKRSFNTMDGHVGARGAYWGVGHVDGVHSWLCRGVLPWARFPVSSSGKWRLWYLIDRCKVPGSDPYLDLQLHHHLILCQECPKCHSLYSDSLVVHRRAVNASTRISVLSMCAQAHTWGNSS